MLNFLNTAILAAAVAAVLPFILHLFSKRKVRTVKFSSITFLKAMRKHQVRAIKIKQLLLLIIRTLIILAVVMAFARPATKGGYLGSHASVSAVIIIDNSASMGLSAKDGILFDLSMKRANDILKQFGPSDEIGIMAALGEYADISEENFFGNSASAKDILDRIDLSGDRANLYGNYNSAVKLLSERLNINKEIYIISDFQEAAFSPSENAAEFDGQIFMVELPRNGVSNCGIINVEFGNRLIEVGTDFPVSTEIKSFFEDGEEELLASLYLDDNRVAQESVRLASGESKSIDFSINVSSPGLHSGYIELSDDDLLADNRFYFSFYLPDQFNILLVGENDLDALLFNMALAPDENLRRHWSVTQIPYGSFASARLNEYDALFFVNYSSLPKGDVARVKEYINNGGGLFLNLGRDSDSAHYTRHLEDLTGVIINKAFPKDFSRRGFFTLEDFSLEHPITSIFKDIADKESLKFKSYAMIRASLAKGDEITMLARYSDGSPAVTVSKRGRGRVIYFGCDLSPDISDISLHPFFVPFLVRSFEFLATGFSPYTPNIMAGSSPRRVLRKGFNVTNEYTLVKPDGTRRMVTADFRDNVRTVSCGILTETGIYKIFNGNVESDRFAVNTDSEEGDLYFAGWDTWEQRLGGPIRFPASANTAGFLSEKRFGRELWHYFLAAALILLAIEMWIARDRGAPLFSEE